ncbi:unnamed protein product [Sympodiomycopsis kandeliae]
MYRAQIFARSLTRSAPCTPNLVSAAAAASRSLHSKSIYGRGRAAIKANGPQRRASSPRSGSGRKTSAPREANNQGNPWSAQGRSPFQRAEPSPEELEAARLEHEKKLQKASEQWPSWLPKPLEIQMYERRQQQQQNDAAGTPPRESRYDAQSKLNQEREEAEGIFIRKGDPAHSSSAQSQTRTSDSPQWTRSGWSWSSSQAGSSSSSSGPRKEPEWPSWLPPRPSTPPRHPITQLFRPSAKQARREFWSKYKGIIIVIVGAGGGYYVYHLEQVPYTGRWRFRDVGESTELRMGQEAFASTMAEYRGKVLPANHPYSKMARQVASRLIQAASDLHGMSFEGVQAGHNDVDPNDTTYARASVAKTQWQVFVIDDPKTKNAFVLPGGQIFVFTGILPFCKDQDGLATVLSHEIAHKLCSHSAEKASGNKIFMGISILIDGLLQVWGVGQWVTSILMSLPNSRTLEEEADALGLRLMSRACFNPAAAPQLWSRMDEGEGGWASEIFSTHPLSKKRMDRLQKQVPAAVQVATEAGCPPAQSVSDFQSRARGRFA